MLAAGAKQHLRYRQADQLGIRQALGLAPAAPGGQHHVIVDLHVQCDQEGVQVVRHSRSWAPSRRLRAVFKESLV